MILTGSIIVIFIISIVLAIRSSRDEFSVPDELTKLKIRRQKPVSGVILFLKKKIVHYTSSISS